MTKDQMFKRGERRLKGDEGSYLPNCQTNFVIVLHALSTLFCNFINKTAYNFG